MQIYLRVSDLMLYFKVHLTWQVLLNFLNHNGPSPPALAEEKIIVVVEFSLASKVVTKCLSN